MSHAHPGADSAGRPWQGRAFDQNAFAGDDGSASVELIAAIEAFRLGSADAVAVVDAVRGARLLIPLIAKLGETGENEHGVTVDKSAELAIVTVSGPDGRDVLPVFSSVAAMSAWNPLARPVPADAVRVGLAAASEQTELVVLDPTSSTEFVLRRPAVWALAQQIPWVPAARDPEVLSAVRVSTAGEPSVVSVAVRAGDPDARLAGPEVLVVLALVPGLAAEALQLLLSRLADRWAADGVLADRVDSLGVELIVAP